ncbi:MAG: ABC transporter substrate-binding protein [bacterium]
MNLTKHLRKGEDREIAAILLLMVGIFIMLIVMACTKKSSRTFTIGILNTSPALKSGIEGFKEGMTEFGFIEGKTISYIYEGPIVDTSKDKLNDALERLLEAKVDLIFSITTPATQVARKITEGKEVPVVFMAVLEPKSAGIVKSLKQPGGNITGVSNGGSNDRRLEWLKNLSPTIKRIYIPYCPDDIAPVTGLKVVREAARKLDLELVTYNIHTRSDIIAATEPIPQEVDAIFLLNDSFIVSHLDDFVNAALTHRLPLSVPNISQVKAGALTSFGFIPAEVGKQGARLADQILDKGANPADLPIELAEFHVAINLRTAAAIDLHIPDEILQQTHIIFR